MPRLVNCLANCGQGARFRFRCFPVKRARFVWRLVLSRVCWLVHRCDVLSPSLQEAPSRMRRVHKLVSKSAVLLSAFLKATCCTCHVPLANAGFRFSRIRSRWEVRDVTRQPRTSRNRENLAESRENLAESRENRGTARISEPRVMGQPAQ